MNIEGTPNERALLVICAYIIGFTSSFIAFNYASSGNASAPVVYMPPTTQVAAVAAPAAEQPPAAAEAVVGVAGLVYENNGLYLDIGDTFPVLLSKNIAATGLSYDQLPTLRDRQGFHTAVIGYEHFEEPGFVYFCEQYDTNTCVPMLYDVAAAALYLVVGVDGPLELTANVANQATMTPAGLVLPGYRSESAATPWVVVVN